LGYNTAEELDAAIKEHRSSLDEDPSIYCGTYAKYNNGSLSGLWIDLSSFDDYDEFIDFCKALHADEEDPELMFQDYQGFPKYLYCESYLSREDFESIQEYVDICQRAGKEVADDCIECDVSLRDFDDAYCGMWDSEEDYARNLVEDCYDLSQMGELARYFDYEAFARDLFMYDYTIGPNGSVFRR
jgi:antirestriction protein